MLLERGTKDSASLNSLPKSDDTPEPLRTTCGVDSLLQLDHSELRALNTGLDVLSLNGSCVNVGLASESLQDGLNSRNSGVGAGTVFAPLPHWKGEGFGELKGEAFGEFKGEAFGELAKPCGPEMPKKPCEGIFSFGIGEFQGEDIGELAQLIPGDDAFGELPWLRRGLRSARKTPGWLTASVCDSFCLGVHRSIA